MNPTKYLAILTATVMSGCVSQYVQPDEAQPSATLTVTSSRESYHEGNYFAIFNDEKCTKTDGFGSIATFSAMTGDKPVTVRVPASRRIFVRAETMIVTAGGGVRTQSNCPNLSSFSPEAGRQYQAHQLRSGNGCALVIADTETKTQPEDIQTFSATNCKIE